MEEHDRPSAALAEVPVRLRTLVSGRRLVLIVGGTLLGRTLSALDQTIVGTAMPHIVAEFGGLGQYAWVFTVYMLASTVVVPIVGKLSDLYGRRPFFVGGMFLFLLGSALSGLSDNMTELIIFRSLQGLGAGALMPIPQAIIGDVFAPAERGKWQGLMMAVYGLASIIGPAVGGWVTDAWGWRWVFYMNLPLGIVAMLAVAFALPGQSQRRKHQIDYLGATTLVAGSVPLLLAFSLAGTTYPWGSVQIIILFILAFAMLTIFLLLERHAVEPMISPGLFRNRVFTISVIAAFLMSAGMFAITTYLPLFVQGVLGETATNSGAVVVPMLLSFVVSSTITGQLMSRTGSYKLLMLGGFVFAAGGLFLLTRLEPTTSNGIVIRDMVIVGLGIGVMGLFTVVVQNAFPLRQLGEVTASLQFFRSIGGTMGVAILGAVLVNRFQADLQTHLSAALKQSVPADLLAMLHNSQVLLSSQATARMQQHFAALGPQGQRLFEQAIEVMRVSLSSAIATDFAIAAVAMVVGLVVTVFLPELPLRRDRGDGTGRGEDGARPHVRRDEAASNHRREGSTVSESRVIDRTAGKRPEK